MDNEEVNYEPMEVDLSAHSVSAMDISFVDKSFDFSPIIIKQEKHDDTELCLNLKPLTINNLIENHSQVNRNGNHGCLKQVSKLIVCIIVGCFALVTYQIVYFKCSKNIDISLLRTTLASKIYGQTTAIDKLLNALESELPTKIIAMYGGTGVGKTYTASLILEDKLQYGNIYHYTMPGFSQSSSDIMLGMIYCESSIIVVDDLNRNDILTVKNHIQDLVTKSEKYSKNIMIILLYNCDTMGNKFFQKCDENFLHELTFNLKHINAQKYFIKFDQLTEEHLRKCIKNELNDKNFSEYDIARIMKNFNVTVDGCKGVYQKMKYLSVV